MKINTRILVFISLFALFLIIVNQLYWIRNIYVSYQKEIVFNANLSLEKAIFMELTERMNQAGGMVAYQFSPTQKDTGKTITRKIQTEDTTFVITIDKDDQDASAKITQFLFKKDMPLNTNSLNHIFSKLILGKYAQVVNTGIEYWDLKNSKVINRSRAFVNSEICTEIMPIDIYDTIGVRAYVTCPPSLIMKRLGYQLLLSVLLIVIACICFLYLLKVIFRQQKIERLRQDFVNAMVHEFKRPISNAGSMMDLIPFYLERKEMDKVGSYVDGCIMEFKKLTAYTDRIQRISNNDPERILLDRTDVPIVHFFANLKEKYVMRKDKTVNLEMSINTTRTTLNVDVLHFSNVMENLMENAIKYSNDPVDIEISVLDVENGIGIYVKDNGYGISDRDKKFIFDKFYRVNAAETKKQVGFGLGLTYVKSIVEAHGGVVRVTDNPHGTGSIFAVLLPF